MVKQHELVSGVDQAPLNSKGVCLWFTGRSGAGKSTIMNALLPLLDECGRVVSVLDVVPLFKKQWWERTSEVKLLRKAFVASEVVRHGGIVICVTVSARSQIREAAREMIGPENFVEVLVDVPPDVAATRKRKRKRKPSYMKRARRGLRRNLARVPFRQRRSYQFPLSPDVAIDTSLHSPEEGAQAIFQFLLNQGFLIHEDNDRGSHTVTEKDGAQPDADQAAATTDESQRRSDLVPGKVRSG